MKNSIWDILTGIMLLGVLCVLGAFGAIMVNPNIAINPLKPGARVPELVPTIALPVPTETRPGLPPTWTPTPQPTATNTPEAAVQPGLRPTSTLPPSPTPFRLPTFTSVPPTRTGASGGRCQVVSQDPQDGSIVTPGSSFITRWTIKNTSDKEWRSDSVDLRYVPSSDPRMHNGADTYDLPVSVPTNGTVDVQVSMRAPDSSGTYISQWGLYEGDRSLCRFFVQIRARRPQD